MAYNSMRRRRGPNIQPIPGGFGMRPTPPGGSGWDNILSRMPKGTSLTPAGDIGERRQRESVAVGGFKDGETVRASSVFKR